MQSLSSVLTDAEMPDCRQLSAGNAVVRPQAAATSRRANFFTKAVKPP